MGIVNATPDSFSDGGRRPDLESRAAHAAELIDEGADVIDVGGESGVTNRAPVSGAEEIERVEPLIGRLAAAFDVPLSIDTYKPVVAKAAIDAGAAMINDPSGLFDPGIADLCADSGAALVITHTRAQPKQKLVRPRYDDIIDDVKGFLAQRIEQVLGAGVAEGQIILCPGPDMGKDPVHTIELLRRLTEVRELGFPLLLALSRKDFIGALTERPPRARLAGTLAAVAVALESGPGLLRVHDVGEVSDFLTVRAALRGDLAVPDDLLLSDDLRWEPITDISVEESTR
jgi:dihydropteroate synthase